jgi:hypothetical protein
MSRFRSFIIRFGAPLVLLAGVAGALTARRAITFKHTFQLWADSLKQGSGPLTLEVPFLPAYLDGRRVGSLKSLRLERHEPRTVDSVRLVIDLSRRAVDDAAVRGCRFELVTFAGGDYKHALVCAADTAGLVTFGRVSFEQGGESPLYVNRAELACAPWTGRAGQGDCIGARVRRDVQRDMDRMRRELQGLPRR